MTDIGAGDLGMTSLLGGERVPKHHARIEACGEVDELASVLGALAAALADGPAEAPELRAELRAVQRDLVTVGARLATAPSSPALASLGEVGGDRVRALEDATRKMESRLPPLQGFLLPGGHPTAAWAHVARTVCRRAERRVLRLASEHGSGDPGLGPVIAYLNRCSTYLYAFARFCNLIHGIPDEPWNR